ncbi:hypothetical protein [Rhodococcus oxybenzonivorans]|uniref:hypothetical protein n=1 Tax=Rhodococcus oxybenzonivorans TaxID=1990687 RepID=UPI001E4D3083|nr:hypothetical protein [Rhodococcus oxybenzonivorans]
MRITRRKADDLLSGSIPLLNASGRIVPDRLVSDVLTTYMRGSGIGPAGVMVMLDIADDARVPDQAALDNCVSVNSLVTANRFLGQRPAAHNQGRRRA